MYSINEFNHWFAVLDWNCSADEMAEKIYFSILEKEVKNEVGKIVNLPQLIKQFKTTQKNNMILLQVPNLHHFVKGLGEIHQSFTNKIISKLEFIS